MNRLSIFTIILLLSGTGLLIHLEKDQNVSDSTDPHKKKKMGLPTSGPQTLTILCVAEYLTP